MAIGDQDIRIRMAVVATGMEQFDKVEQSIKKINNKIDIFSKEILFAGLGTMFFGMAMQRFFGGIAKTGTQAFRDIIESSNNASTALGGVAAAGTFLQFTIGDAINTVLEPLMPLILSIVNVITDWIQQNPQLVGGIILVGLVLGKLLSFLAQLAIGIPSIIKFIGMMKGALIGLFTTLMAHPIILVIAAIIAAIYLLWTNWDTVVKFLSDAWNWLWNTIFKPIWENIGKPIVDAIAGALKWLHDTIWKPLVESLGAIWNALGDGIKWVWENIIKPVFDLIVGGLKFIKGMWDASVGAIVGFFEGAGQFLGDVASGIGEAVFGPPQQAAAGGYVSKGGLAEIHSGETITPASKSAAGINIVVNAQGAMFTDRESMTKLANQIGEIIVTRVSNATSSAGKLRG